MSTVRTRLINFKVTPAEYEAIQAYAQDHFGDHGVSKWLRARGLSDGSATDECMCMHCAAVRKARALKPKETIHGQSG